MHLIYLSIPLIPLLGALIVGLLCRVIPRWFAHTITTLGVGASFVLSIFVFQDVQAGHLFNGNLYTWLRSGDWQFSIGFLIDPLSAIMMLVVTFVSLMVHLYTIGYMHEDPGYNRFFSYISLFTVAMLVLVMSNNFLQLFFAWEAVGLISYLLIGFWFKRPTAIYANLKAFLVNRVGDLGFLLGIGLVLAYFGTLDYAQVFNLLPTIRDQTIHLWGNQAWSIATVIAILLFIGAMGKSAQVPLHVWLPDSMEGPTPISALIHAATMVTAGIFMVSRMSPIFELSETALSFVLVIGATTALFMGFLGMVQHDIKRIVAYSTLSQLGYMTVALGASAYSVAIFHLMTHAFFKALLFLAAGSVIMGMHHDQDVRHMGGLRKYMPITWFCSLMGSLALIGTPFFSGFYSKDTIIEAVKLSQIPGANYAYLAVLLGVFVTAFYSFRMYFLVFHGPARFVDQHEHGQHAESHIPHESPWVITLPLVLLAIPSVGIGFLEVQPMLFENFWQGALWVDGKHDVIRELAKEFHGPVAMALHVGLPLILAALGVALAWVLYLVRPHWPDKISRQFKAIHTLLQNKYYFDRLNELFFAKGSRSIGSLFWLVGDRFLIDGLLVNGSAKLVGIFSRAASAMQTGYVYHYAFTMMVGVAVFLTLWLN